MCKGDSPLFQALSQSGVANKNKPASSGIALDGSNWNNAASAPPISHEHKPTVLAPPPPAVTARKPPVPEYRDRSGSDR